MEEGIGKIEQAEAGHTKRLIEGINAIGGIRLIGPGMDRNRGNVVSVCLEKTPVAAAALMMDSAFQIAVRSGIHCAADAHRSAGTLENGGALRISPNYFNTPGDIDICLHALELCARGI
jgi:selenocysteine lyase/cysteine desulfurase